MDVALREDEAPGLGQTPKVALKVFINSEHRRKNVLQFRFKYSIRIDEEEGVMIWVEALSVARDRVTVDCAHERQVWCRLTSRELEA